MKNQIGKHIINGWYLYYQEWHRVGVFYGYTIIPTICIDFRSMAIKSVAFIWIKWTCQFDFFKPHKNKK